MLLPLEDTVYTWYERKITMEDQDPRLDLGMLCRFCDCRSYKLPDVEGFSQSERQAIEDLCKICIENPKPVAVNY